MDLLFWGLTIGITGKILLGVTVLSVHRKIVKEHHIDVAVLNEMRHEQTFAIIAIGLMIIGYLFEIAFYEYITILFGV